jgi:hypothetical protein
MREPLLPRLRRRLTQVHAHRLGSLADGKRRGVDLDLKEPSSTADSGDCAQVLAPLPPKTGEPRSIIS